MADELNGKDNEVHGINNVLADKKCPGCGAMFRSLGRHRRFCTGNRVVAPDNIDKILDDFVETFKMQYGAMKNERDIYKSERDNLLEWRTRINGLLKGIDIENPPA